jgi:DNA-binding NtrC family response regulator
MTLTRDRALVLVAFGEQSVRRLMELELTDAGLDVIATSTADDALDLMRIREPDLVIIDRFLVGEASSELLMHLADLRDTTKLVVTCDTHDVERARLDTPDAEVMLKPFVPGQLVDVCRELLDSGPPSPIPAPPTP